MENTTPTTGPSNKKILVFTVLLILGTLFWLWSITYRDSRINTPVMQPDQSSINEVTDLDAEINSSLSSDSEIELRGIDEEFN